jgi:dynein intermediate chain
VYEKHTQTIVDENEKTEIYQEEDDDNLQPNTLSHKKTEYDDKKSEVNVAVREELSYIAPHGTLSEDNKKMILQSEDFSMFIERSSIVMERALAETSDILFDLALSREVGGDKDVLSTINIVRKKQFSDERWTKGRMISSIAWSPHHTGIVLASYYQLDKTTSDPDGVVLMWDLKFVKDTPDYVFNCHSSVMSVTFSKFHPHFVIGGTYSGQIVLWDIRSGKRTPVQRSLLSTSAHTHPIYCLEVVGSLNAHNLISVSTDGRLCCWNLDNLSQPQDYADLQNRNPRAVVVTSLSFPKNEVNKFVVGSEEGVVYQCQRHGKKPGDVVVQYDGHFGAVTAVSCHQATNNHNDFSHLFLSSSFDWTVKLWSLKLLNEQQITSKSATPICSFETNNDYVLDVKWSPVHPALFVTVNGEGRIDFWNINHDSEVPILTEVVDVALAKVQWSPNGQLLAAGDVEGSLYIYEAGEVSKTIIVICIKTD